MIALLSALALAGGPLPEGRYALEVDVATSTKVPFFGDTRMLTTSVLLVDVEARGDALVQRQRLCAVRIDDGTPLARTIIPDAFIAATPVQTYPITLTREGERWTYEADPGPAHVGWDPGVAPRLPDAADDPGVLDFDGDGHPGATVELRVPLFGRVEVYVVQSGWSVLQGVVEGGAVTGRVDVRILEQRTLGASHRAFDESPPTRVLREESVFRMSPVAADATCVDLAE